MILEFLKPIQVEWGFLVFHGCKVSTLYLCFHEAAEYSGVDQSSTVSSGQGACHNLFNAIQANIVTVTQSDVPSHFCCGFTKLRDILLAPPYTSYYKDYFPTTSVVSPRAECIEF